MTITMNKKATLSVIELDPEEKATKSIIWLHGLGADGNDFVPIVPELKLPKSMNVRYIFPNAPVMPVTLNNGYQMRAWYDIYGLGKGFEIDAAGIAKSVQAIDEIINQEIERGVDSKNILLAGFSQGSVIALTTGLQFDKPLAGLIALSGYLPLAAQVIANGSVANKQIPIFIGHGTEDPMVSVSLGITAFDALKAAHYPVTLHTYPMPHSVCPQEIQDISEFIKGIWSS